jgi:hypothetical protein
MQSCTKAEITINHTQTKSVHLFDNMFIKGLWFIKKILSDKLLKKYCSDIDHCHIDKR